MAITWPAKNNYATGDVLTATNMNGIGDDLNALFDNSFYAGKNKFINGDFSINQRAFTSTTTNATYGFDRWFAYTDGSCTYSAQTFTPGTAPVAGYEAANYARLLTAAQNTTTGYSIIAQRIEDVRTFANQQVTLSFWAKAASGTPKLAAEILQKFGSGGSPSADVTTYIGQVTLSTSWARYSLTFNVPTISGKTIGTTANTSSLELAIWASAGSNYNSRTNSIGVQNNTIDFWGMQFEAGSTATPFQTATGTKQGELAACQRYYWRNTGAIYTRIGNGIGATSTNAQIVVQNPVQMRVAPTSLDYSNLGLYDQVNLVTVTSATIDAAGVVTNNINMVVASGLTQFRPYVGYLSSASGYLGLSAEL